MLRLAERSLTFNVNALTHVVSSCFDGTEVNNICDFAGGGFNRVFHNTLVDGREVIAQISCQICVPERWTTGSKVATLEYLRSRFRESTPGLRIRRMRGLRSEIFKVPLVRTRNSSKNSLLKPKTGKKRDALKLAGHFSLKIMQKLNDTSRAYG